MMNGNIWFCEKCKNEGRGFISGYSPFKLETCHIHKTPMTKIDINSDDFFTIRDISEAPALLEAMIALKEKDIIEYELKMSQFRSQVSQKEKAKEVEAKKPNCPRCGSTDISETTKGFTFVTGFLNSSDIRMYCKNCHHKWKPNSLNEDITRLINKKF